LSFFFPLDCEVDDGTSGMKGFDDFVFVIDGKHANLTVNDVQRRNRIACLLADWGLITVVKPEAVTNIAPLNQIKVLAYKDKGDWILEQKYNIGKKGKVQETE
jgi:hypothetical protein